MHNTQTLVITFALRELFRTKSKTLEKRMLTIWEHSRRIAAISYVLAGKVSGLNEHEALLAGLVHDIGALEKSQRQNPQQGAGEGDREPGPDRETVREAHPSRNR